MKRIISMLIVFAMLFFIFGCGKKDSESIYTGIVEGKVYSLNSPLSEKIIFLPFHEGEQVQAGELIALLDTTSTMLQIKQAESMQEALKLQQENANLQYDQAKTSYEYFLDMYQKNISLSKSKAIPSQKLEEIKLQMTVNKTKLEMAELNKKILAKKFNETEFQLLLLREKLKKTHLRAPASGIIDKLYYDKGETPAPLSTIADVVNLDNVWCYIYVTEVDLANIQIDKGVTVRVDGIDENLSGKINYINQQAEFTPKTIMTPDNRKALVFGVKVTIENKNHVLKPGMPVEVEL